MLQHIVFL